MKMLAVRNFFSTSHLYFFQETQLGLFIFIYSFIFITFLIWYKSSCLNLIVVWVTVTSEDVCWSIRNVKFLNVSFYNMRCVVMFITAVCLIFLLKLKWPKNKSVYDLLFCVYCDYWNSKQKAKTIYRKPRRKVTKLKSKFYFFLG